MSVRNGRLVIATALGAAFIIPRVLQVAAQAPPSAVPSSAVAVPATAPVYQLTLAQARERALSHNKSLTLARLNTDVSQHATAAARRDYLPKVLANDTFFHFDSPLGSVVTAGGGPAGLIPARTINANVVNQDANFATIMVAQPITKLIAVNAQVQLARADQEIANAKLDQGTRDLLSGVTQAYYGLLGGQRIQAALELQIKFLEQAAGANPVPEVRVRLLEARQGLVQVRGQVRELVDQMNSLLDFPPCTQLVLVEPVPSLPNVHSADEAADLALACSGEVREAKANISKAEAALKVARMDYLPDVNVVGGYGNQTGADYIQPNFGFVGVTGSYTLWDWGKRREVKQQRQSQIVLAHQNLAVVSDKVALEARKTFGSFEQALEAYRLAGEMVQARKEAEKSAAQPVALMTAKGETAKAELEFMKAEIAYRVAHAQLTGLLAQ